MDIASTKLPRHRRLRLGIAVLACGLPAAAGCTVESPPTGLESAASVEVDRYSWPTEAVETWNLGQPTLDYDPGTAIEGAIEGASDSIGGVHLLYVKDGEAIHAVLRDDTWSREIIAGGVGDHGLAVTRDGRARVVLTTATELGTEVRLLMQEGAGGSWTPKNLTTCVDENCGTAAVAVDAHGRTHVAYFVTDAAPNGRLEYRVFDDALNVVEGYNLGLVGDRRRLGAAAIALSEGGAAHIVYADAGLRHFDVAAGTVEKIPLEATVMADGIYNSRRMRLFVDAFDRLHLVHDSAWTTPCASYEGPDWAPDDGTFAALGPASYACLPEVPEERYSYLIDGLPSSTMTIILAPIDREDWRAPINPVTVRVAVVAAGSTGDVTVTLVGGELRSEAGQPVVGAVAVSAGSRLRMVVPEPDGIGGRDLNFSTFYTVRDFDGTWLGHWDLYDGYSDYDVAVDRAGLAHITYNSALYNVSGGGFFNYDKVTTVESSAGWAEDPTTGVATWEIERRTPTCGDSHRVCGDRYEVRSDPVAYGFARHCGATRDEADDLTLPDDHSVAWASYDVPCTPGSTAVVLGSDGAPHLFYANHTGLWHRTPDATRVCILADEEVAFLSGEPFETPSGVFGTCIENVAYAAEQP